MPERRPTFREHTRERSDQPPTHFDTTGGLYKLRRRACLGSCTALHSTFQSWCDFEMPILILLQANNCLESGVSATSTLGPATLTTESQRNDLSRLLTHCVIRTADLMAAYKNTCVPSADQDLVSILERARDIKNLEQWPKQLPPHWKFSMKRSPSWPEEYAYGGRCETY